MKVLKKLSFIMALIMVLSTFPALFSVTTAAAEEYEAMIGDVGYTTLEEAVGAAVASSQTNSAAEVTVKLLKDVTIDSTSGLNVGSNGAAAHNLIIDGNGHTVTNSLASGVVATFYCYSGTTTLKNITINTTTAGLFSAIISRYGAKVILENANVNVKGTASAAIYLNNSSSVEFKGKNIIKTASVALNRGDTSPVTLTDDSCTIC